jgi:hypothetical protein
MKSFPIEVEGPHLEVKHLRRALKGLPPNAKLFFVAAGHRMKTSKIHVDHSRHTRLVQRGELNYVHGLENEVFDRSQPDYVTISFNIASPLTPPTKVRFK